MRVTLAVGQAVTWPHAPGGLAQIEELRRCCVRLVYRCHTGRWRHPIVHVRALQAVNQNAPPLPLNNPLGRGVLARSKAFNF